MYRLLETVKLLDGVFQNLFYHNERMNRTRRELEDCTDLLDLEVELDVPEWCQQGVYKCRVLYEKAITQVTFEQYHKRPITSLKVVAADDISYDYKFEDRSYLQALREHRCGCDEIIIVKGNRLTDTSFSNLAFFTGREWLTPGKPLLHGTKRAQLLANSYLSEADLKVTDLKYFKKIALINAMLELEECVVLTDNISL